MSSALVEEAKKDPERFYRLSSRFDDDISFRYVQALISALTDTPQAQAEWAFDLILRFADRISPDDRRSICWALEKRSQENVPDELLELLTRWALTDPDPTRETWEEKDSYGNKQHKGEPYDQGLNCNRGVSVLAVAQCALHREPPQTARVFTLLEKAVADPSTAVRSIVVECLSWMLRYGEDERALRLFEQAMTGHPRLLQSPPTHRFLHRCYRLHFPRIRPFIEQMLADGTHEQTRLNGASLSYLAFFDHAEAEKLVQQALAGDAVSRRGVAQVCARNLTHPELRPEIRDLCRQRLLELMQDPDESVRESVGSCFENLGESDFYSSQDFVRAYVRSPALEVSSRKLIEFVLNFVGHEQELLLEAAERCINIQESKQHEGGKHHIDRVDHGDLTKLTLSLYTHAPDDETRERALALFERLLAAGSHFALAALSEWDRR